MIANYHTLHALITEWQTSLIGCTLEDVWSQKRDELSLAFSAPGGARTVRIGVRLPLLFIVCADGYARARRNVTTLFEPAIGRKVETLRIADRDRIIFLGLSGGRTFHIPLFGPHANVFLVADDRIARVSVNSASASRTAPGARPRYIPGIRNKLAPAGPLNRSDDLPGVSVVRSCTRHRGSRAGRVESTGNGRYRPQ